MNKVSLLTVVALLVALLIGAAPAGANDDGSFTVAGTVAAVRCPELGKLPSKPAFGRCEVELEVAAKGELGSVPGRVRVGCSDPTVAAACRLLLPGDEALIAGRKSLQSKEASHVALMLEYLRQHDGDEPIPSPLWLKFDQPVRFEGLWVQFQEVIQDTRCPADVECVWPGECTVALGFWRAVTDPGDVFGTYLGTYELTLGADPAAAEVMVDGYLVRLGNMYPEPRTDLPPPQPSDCFLLVEVEEVMD